MSSIPWISNPTCIARNEPSSLSKKSNKVKAAFVDDLLSHQTSGNLSAEVFPFISAASVLHTNASFIRVHSF